MLSRMTEQRRLSPLSGGTLPPPPPPDGPMVHVGDHGKIHALYGYYIRHEYKL